VPFTPKKQMPQGFRQVVVRSHVWPQVAAAWVLVRSWWTDIALAERTPSNIVANRNFFTIGILLTVSGQALGIPAGRCLWCPRPGQNNSRMDVYRYRRWCRNFHTPQLRVCLFSIGAEITLPPKERL
jgi:hypothetical protein